jgi:peroxiredoxin family protein
MASKPLYIMLCSGEHEKIQLAAMIASVAAVSDRPVEVFVTMNAVLAFERGKAPAERYHGGHFHDLFMTKKVPDAIELFGQGKMLGDLKMWVCSMVLDLKHWEIEKDLAEDLFDGPAGLAKFLADAESGELITI